MFHDNDNHVSNNDVNPFHHHALQGEPYERENYERPFHLQSAHDVDLRVDIPEFEGRIHQMISLIGSIRLNECSTIMKCPMRERSKLFEEVCISMVGAAESSLRANKKVEDHIVGKDEEEIVPDNYIQECYMRLYDLRQGHRTVNGYTEEFDLLTMQCAMAELDEQTIARCIGGLRKEICDVVVLQPHYRCLQVSCDC